MNYTFLIILLLSAIFFAMPASAYDSQNFEWGDSYQTVLKKSKHIKGKKFISAKAHPNNFDKNCKFLSVVYQLHDLTTTEVYNICRNKLKNIIFPLSSHYGPFNNNDLNYVNGLIKNCSKNYKFLRKTNQGHYNSYEYIANNDHLSIIYKNSKNGTSFVYLVLSSMPQPNKITVQKVDKVKKIDKLPARDDKPKMQPPVSHEHNANLEEISQALGDIRK